ncbi:LacI family DNA-binding transcriptional regulator [Paraburkholderia sediminicola]|uniref:LacI family DNA-binding transcriptional regulator n=1 Tax=Paraburkholderia sediminicola TaxID=458836 RepID=UPI0038BB5F10
MSTIQDVARQAAVSVSTVSNVLNGRTDRMRPETLLRVEAVIAELQFRPNSLARRLKTGQTPLLGLLVPSIANPMYGMIARAVETFAQEQYGYRVIVGNTYRERDKEAAFLEDLLAHGVRRVVVISSLADEHHLTQAVERGMVVVSFDRRATPGEVSGIDHVTPDNFEAGRLATRHLIAYGHTRLAFATVAGLTVGRNDKIRGFLAAAAEAGLQQHARILEGGPMNEYGDAAIGEVGRELAKLAARDPHRPTGVVAVNDMMALGFMAGLRDAGLLVPHDMSVVGMDGLFLAEIANPALTTLQLPVTEMARAMVQRAMSRQSHLEPAADEQVFPFSRLIERESVGPPPVSETKAPITRRKTRQ